MSSEAITSVFNDGYIAEMFDAYKRDPASVDESWRQFFRIAAELGGQAAGQNAGQGALNSESLRAAAGAASLADAIRAYGHMAVAIDPLGSPPPGAAELSPEFHHVSEAELASLPGFALGLPDATAADAIRRLRALYCSTL
ncbi:MAG: 2-oxoglutarate dehydrogenase E1 subunit family protein, partial [Gemmatimonadaceae bacterium]